MITWCLFIFVLLVVSFVEEPLKPPLRPIVMTAQIIFLVYFTVMLLKSICGVEKWNAVDAARLLFRRRGRTREKWGVDLPEKLRGVFWFKTNAAPELLMTFEGSYYDPERHFVKMDAGGTYNWTYSADKVGWIYWFMLRVSYIFCAELTIAFKENEEEHADMPLYVCGCCCNNSTTCDGLRTPMGMWWEMHQIDENTWDRHIYLYCMPWKKWETGSYTLVRIIDGEGRYLPEFENMVASVTNKEKVRGILVKPELQLLNGDDWTGSLFQGEGSQQTKEERRTLRPSYSAA